VRSAMARMRWWRLEWERKARTHEPLADPHLSVSTERERRKQQRRGKKAERQRIRRLKQRQRMSASRTEAQGSFHAATLKAVARVSRERETRAPAVIARELGIGEATAARYLAELERGR
jgi:response regulator of citrate/malate metabolism